ncbi:3-carboxy-cis,cis-muconate cycloisomerase [Spongiactinospora sp. TRM90649]|uniref:3-carboxy-cis,cis-muconate cycloisomerase n=1 Tax=Spongiactinospora sp. TRM90649 TaxID=3031114 RepID=UPI0023F67503|nr:3-carboxy-cis,cis-muconate cycloisomerase [Spongiactinospora sp. TRM90649]MDF5753279.1 3-carboxy-cis,cis-muconate cycloisomerase [Spongiactinospora sp. TRM90649]
MEGVFAGTFARGGVPGEVSGAAWLAAMLDAEAGLAAAQARIGLLSDEAADAVAGACRPERFDLHALAEAEGPAGNPVIPLVAALRGLLPAEHRGAAHLGATSQDILDTAAMLVAKGALLPLRADLDAAADACAVLAARHRDTVMPGRTLLQQAVPTTFGLKAAGWLTALDAARARLTTPRLPVQYGGAAGTLSALPVPGPEVIAAFAAELDLDEPVVPWHTDRTPVAELAGALGTVAGVLAKIATDVTLLAQTEVAEVAEPTAPGRGRSSAMPHKRNPVGAVSVLANSHRVPGLVATLLAGMAHEHERAAGTWQAEQETLSDLLRLTGSAASWAREILEGLHVDTERMRANLTATGGLALAESVVARLGGGSDARAAVDAACARALAEGTPLREVLIADDAVPLTPGEIDAALDPAGYLGSAGVFVDRALAAHGEKENL